MDSCGALLEPGYGVSVRISKKLLSVLCAGLEAKVQQMVRSKWGPF